MSKEINDIRNYCERCFQSKVGNNGYVRYTLYGERTISFRRGVLVESMSSAITTIENDIIHGGKR